MSTAIIDLAIWRMPHASLPQAQRREKPPAPLNSAAAKTRPKSRAMARQTSHPPKSATHVALAAARAQCNERMVQLQELKLKLAAANAKNKEMCVELEVERTAHAETMAWMTNSEAAAASARNLADNLQRHLEDAREANGLLSSSLATKISQLAESQAQLEAVHEESAKLKTQLAAAQAAVIIVKAAEEQVAVGIEVESAQQQVAVGIEVESAEEQVTLGSEVMETQALEASADNEAIVSEMHEALQHLAAPPARGDTMVLVYRMASGGAGHMSALECEPQQADTDMDGDVSVRVGCLPLPSYRKLLAWGSRHLLRRSRSGRTDGNVPDDVPSDRGQVVGNESETTGY